MLVVYYASGTYEKEKFFDNPQRTPVEDATTKGTDAGKYKLCLEWGTLPDYVVISNRGQSGNPIHEVRIEGDRGIISKTLIGLTNALKEIKSVMRYRIEVPLALLPRTIDKKYLPQMFLPNSGLRIILGSKFERNLIFIERVENGDTVSISEDNLHPLKEELDVIRLLFL
jgi:hypothetical protein